MSKSSVAFFAVLISLFISTIVYADHEMDHRYYVTGYVRDAEGNAKSNVLVSVSHKGGQKKAVRTGSSGYYEVFLHLHNVNLGDEILVVVGEVEKRTKLVFDPKDNASSRESAVDFGAKGKDGGGWIYLTGASLTALAFFVYFGLIKKRAPQSDPKKESKRKKKKTRK